MNVLLEWLGTPVKPRGAKFVSPHQEPSEKRVKQRGYGLAWYRKNAEQINRARRERWRTDKAWRDAQVERFRRSRAR